MSKIIFITVIADNRVTVKETILRIFCKKLLSKNKDKRLFSKIKIIDKLAGIISPKLLVNCSSPSAAP